METEMESRIADPFSWDGHEAETLLVCESGSGRAKELVAVVIVKTEGRPEAFYRVREAGEKDVDFESWLEAVDYYNCIGVESHPATPDTGIAKTELQDEDWKTAIAQKKPTIPAGAVVKITGTLQNMYGDFVKVEYNGVKYTVEPRKLIRNGTAKFTQSRTKREKKEHTDQCRSQTKWTTTAKFYSEKQLATKKSFRKEEPQQTAYLLGFFILY